MPQYIGEHLLPRQVGHIAIILSFVSALLATVAYFVATQKRNDAMLSGQWTRVARFAFGTHALSVLTVVGTIFYVMVSKEFEYFYAHSHVDKELPFKYIFAAFWEGQEGSFLLWMFWHVVLGSFIMLRYADFNIIRKVSLKSKPSLDPLSETRNPKSEISWELPTLAVLSSVQVFLASMILGIHIGWGEHLYKLGSNPILLLREANDAPIFAQADYIEKIANTARGLNPLLQNYWMTIHPPVLFLGFASVTIPFCFAIAGLWTKQYTAWLKPAMPFALFSATILGTGILMGGAWAYEALSFNGYWAWDPVENMSLVPWLVMVAGIHTHLITRTTGHSLRATFGFYLLSFLLVLYSTFLTRSGILGDTSAHAFTEMGLEWQLVIFQFFFLGAACWLYFKNRKFIPTNNKEESIASKEFWMLIGASVLLLCVIFISFTTSIPVYNKISGFLGETIGFKSPHFTAPLEPVKHYNKTQLWIGVFMGLLSGGAQFLRFKENNFAAYQSKFLKHIGIVSAAALALTFLSAKILEMTTWQHYLLMFAGVFTLIANGEYLVVFMRKNLKAAGSAFSHLGFGILIVGIMFSGLNKRWISTNRFAMEGLFNFTQEQFNKNVLLMRGLPMFMSNYEVVYASDTVNGNRRDFTLHFTKRDSAQKIILDTFTTHPYILYDKKTGKIASTNPDTRHTLAYDIFTHIAALPPSEQDPEIAKREEDSLKYEKYDMHIGEAFTPNKLTKKTPPFTVTIDSITEHPKTLKYQPEKSDIALGVYMTLHGISDFGHQISDSIKTKSEIRNPKSEIVSHIMPIVLVRENNAFQLPATANELGVRLKIEPEVFQRMMAATSKNAAQELTFTEGEKQKFGESTIIFNGIDAKPDVGNFTLQAGDLAFGANLTIESPKGVFLAKPIYVIRGTQPIPITDDVRELGLNFTISKVKPETRQFVIKITERDIKSVVFPVAIAEDAPRTDYIVLEATVNPGINLVWIGCILMLFGLGLAMYNRIRQYS